jgi:hypothetical protein
MSKHRPCVRAFLILSSILILAASVASAHDGHIYNPDPKPGLPAISSPKLDLITESFEGTFPPTGWASLHLGNSYQWAQTDNTSHTGTYSAWVQYGPSTATMNEWLVTPALDFTGLTYMRMEFYETAAWWDNYGDHHYVMVSTTSQTDPASFTVLADMTPSNHSIGAFDSAPLDFDLSAYDGESTVYVALRYTGSDADDWYVDDLRIYQPLLHNVSVLSLTPDLQQFADGEVFMPQVTVKNVGRSIEDFDMEVTIWESGTQVYNETVNVAALAPWTETVVDFPTLSANGGEFYDLHAVALLGTDMDTSNNEATAFDDAYTLPHVPLGILLTQADCSGCPQANTALDAYIPGQGNDVALLRVHVWWPGTDGIYNANIPQNQFLAYGSGADYAPHLRIDQVVDAGSVGSGYAALFNTRKTHHSPLNIVHSWDPVTETVIVEVEVVESIPADWILKLRIAVTEDDVYEAGTNGERYHDQAFRYMYPDTDGFTVPHTPGIHRFSAHCPVSTENWVYSKLRATVYVQNDETWKVQNAATGFLTDLDGTTISVDHPAPELLSVRGNHPNPFNPETAIKYDLALDKHVRLSIFDVDGGLVRILVDEAQTAGSQTAVWDGRDANGRLLSSGTYFYRVEAGNMSSTHKMVMIK